MAMPATQIRRGMVLVFEGDPCRVVEFRHHTPGNLRAMVQAKLKNLRTFKLKNANVINVGQIVQQLGLNVNVSILEKSQMLVVHGSEAALKEVADLIAELDVEGKPIKDITPKQ